MRGEFFVTRKLFRKKKCTYLYKQSKLLCGTDNFVETHRSTYKQIGIVLQVPTTQREKMSIDPKFVELTADVLEIFLFNRCSAGKYSAFCCNSVPGKY